MWSERQGVACVWGGGLIVVLGVQAPTGFCENDLPKMADSDGRMTQSVQYL